MAKESSLVFRVCDFITKYSILALIFLVPIFFLPWTTDVLDFNKQALLVILVFISLFALMLKTLISGKFEIKKNLTHKIAGGLFLAYLLATIFSIYKYGSFWGTSQQMAESMLTAVCLLIFYFLLSSTFSKKEIFLSITVFSISVVIAQLIGILQLFGLFILPFDFTKSTIFNLVGSVGSLGFLSAIFLPLAIVSLIMAKKWWKALFIAGIVFSTLLFVLINYPIIWWVVVIGSGSILVLGTMKRDLFNGSWMALPMFFLAISLFFVLIPPQINWLPQKPNEIFLSQKAGLDIGMSSLKASPLVGSGLGTFAYDFSKFKNPDFGKSSLWNVTFNKSSSKVLNNLATTGILGFLALLAFMALPVFYGVKILVAKKDSAAKESANQTSSILLLGISVALIEEIVAYFLYNSNVVLDFTFFFTVAILIGLISENKKEYLLKSSSLFNLITTFAFTLFFIFGLGLIILNGQRYIAEVNYYNGLVNYQANHKVAGLKNLEAAANLNPQSDVYFRQLSQAYLLSLQDELQNTKAGTAPTDAEKSKVQTLVANSVNAGKYATDLNPKDTNNWISRGFVYQNLFGILGDTSAVAISSYDSALKLDPSNPYLFFQEGSVYLASALNLSLDKADQKNQFLAKAQTQLEKAVVLNPSYSNALYSLGIVYDTLGQETKATDVFTKLQQLNPSNKNIPTILANIKAGKPAVQIATPPVETPSSTSSKGTNGTVENPPVKITPTPVPATK